MTIDRHGLNVHIGGASILVVERESVARTSLSELFRDEGHRVHEAPDSNSAIVQINNDPDVKVIMLDVEMASWRTVVTHARDTLPAAIILGMSAQDSNRVVLEAQRLGVHGFLVKPLLFDDVCKTILRLMTGRPLH
jgi:two-component system response regulator HydG